MEKYEYMLVFLRFEKQEYAEVSETDPKTKKKKVKIFKREALGEKTRENSDTEYFKKVLVMTRKYVAKPGETTKRVYDSWVTKEVVHWHELDRVRMTLSGYCFDYPEQPLDVLLCEVIAKLGLEGWHIVESKMSNDVSIFGAVILERKIPESELPAIVPA